MKGRILFFWVFILLFTSFNLVLASCIDSDNGLNYNVKGYVYGNNTNGTFDNWDFCRTSKELIEYECSNEYMAEWNVISYSCQDKCINGACIKSKQFTSFLQSPKSQVLPFVTIFMMIIAGLVVYNFSRGRLYGSSKRGR